MSLLGLIYKKRKKTQRADRVQWPSFVQAGMPVSGCHIGYRTASDFRAERAVCRVGGQMDGGYTAQLSSASFPLLAHSISPHLSLSPAHSFIHSANLLSGCSHALPPFHSRLLFLDVFFVSECKSKDTFIHSD